MIAIVGSGAIGLLTTIAWGYCAHKPVCWIRQPKRRRTRRPSSTMIRAYTL